MKCELRKWQLADAADLAAVLSNKNIQNNLRDGIPFPYTERNAADFIAQVRAADENDTFAYAITAGGRVIGSIGAFRQQNIHSETAELGYYLAEEYWGQGIMTDAIRRICALIFDTTDILRIYAEPFAYNIGSCRALEKAGFTYEGTMKNNAVKNGKLTDMKLYACTRSIKPYAIRRLVPEQIGQACDLAWTVFCQFEAPVYSAEGVAEFRKALDDSERNSQMIFYGAFCGAELVGMLAMRGSHISLFFVKADYHRRGIGRSLFEAMRQDYERQVFTVHSAPFAVEIYRRLGFSPTDAEQVANGIRYTPMRFAE